MFLLFDLILSMEPLDGATTAILLLTAQNWNKPLWRKCTVTDFAGSNTQTTVEANEMCSCHVENCGIHKYWLNMFVLGISLLLKQIRLPNTRWQHVPLRSASLSHTRTHIKYIKHTTRSSIFSHVRALNLGYIQGIPGGRVFIHHYWNIQAPEDWSHIHPNAL